MINLFNEVRLSNNSRETQMKSSSTAQVVVFPAIIAVTRRDDSHSQSSETQTNGLKKHAYGFAAIQKATLDEIETAILLSLTTNDWIIRGQAESTLSADLWDGVDTRRVVITYDTESISIEDLATDKGDKNLTPARAIRNLMNDIQRNLLAGVSM